MVRCHIWESQCASDDEVFGREHRGIACRRHWAAKDDAGVRPKCAGESTIGAIEVQ